MEFSQSLVCGLVLIKEDVRVCGERGRDNLVQVDLSHLESKNKDSTDLIFSFFVLTL